MIRSTDPTSAILFEHYRKHIGSGSDSLATLIVNIVFVRNTMSKQVVKLTELGQMPWLRIKNGRIEPESQRAADAVFLKLGGKVFFESAQPMKNRSKTPRRGWGELVQELIAVAGKANTLADLWRGENAVEQVAAKIRSIPGFGGKGFRIVVPPLFGKMHHVGCLVHVCFV